MSNFHIERLIYILSPFLGAHLVAAILTYAHFKFKCDRLSSWKEGAWVYLGMTAFQMIFEYYYFKMVPGERLAFRLETDIIIGWSAFFGMITYPISSREIKKRMKSDHQRIQPYSWIKSISPENYSGLILVSIGLIVSLATLTLFNSSIIDLIRGEFKIQVAGWMLGAFCAYVFFLWCLEGIKDN